MNHIKVVHHGIKPYECNQCQYSTGFKGNLKKHILIHVVEEAVKSKTQITEEYYQSQEKRYLSNGEDDLIDPVTGKMTNVDVDDAQEETEHEMVEEATNTDRSSNQDKDELIGGRSKGEFTPLQKFHIFQCDLCPFKSNKHQLARHVKTTHHRSEKNFRCEQCSYLASCKSALKRHVEAKHEKIRNHICEECGFAAAAKGNLKKHIQSKHEKVRKSLAEKMKKYGM